MTMRFRPLIVLAALGLAGCTTLPSGPGVAVMPAPNKPFEIFVADDMACRDYAQRQIGVNPAAQEQNQVASSAAAGAAIGAAAGALIGHGEGEAVAVGAGSGLLVGTAAGTERAGHDSYMLQQRYDIAYMQCMYAKGNQVPGYPMASTSPLPPPPPPR